MRKPVVLLCFMLAFLTGLVLLQGQEASAQSGPHPPAAVVAYPPDGGTEVIVVNTVQTEARFTGQTVTLEASVTPESFSPLLEPTCEAYRGMYLSSVGTTPVQLTGVDGGLPLVNQLLVKNLSAVAGCCDELALDGGLPDCTSWGTELDPSRGTILFQGLQRAVFCRAKVGVVDLNLKGSTCTATSP